MINEDLLGKEFAELLKKEVPEMTDNGADGFGRLWANENLKTVEHAVKHLMAHTIKTKHAPNIIKNNNYR